MFLFSSTPLHQIGDDTLDKKFLYCFPNTFSWVLSAIISNITKTSFPVQRVIMLRLFSSMYHKRWLSQLRGFDLRTSPPKILFLASTSPRLEAACVVGICGPCTPIIPTHSSLLPSTICCCCVPTQILGNGLGWDYYCYNKNHFPLGKFELAHIIDKERKEDIECHNRIAVYGYNLRLSLNIISSIFLT